MSYYEPPPDRQPTEDDYHRMANNYADWTRFATWTHQRRYEAARTFGPNWACVLSGMGDQ